MAADLTNKSVVNEATYRYPGGRPLRDHFADDGHEVNVRTAITLVKSAMPATFNQAPRYSPTRFLVTNTGSVTLNRWW
ncbi:MAG: hypothetical protein IPM11_00005 [Micropruina sp.]|nr:hypothetical protein [Micropruina sp.]